MGSVGAPRAPCCRRRPPIALRRVLVQDRSRATGGWYVGCGAHLCLAAVHGIHGSIVVQVGI